MNEFEFNNDFHERRRTEYAVVIFLPQRLDSIVSPFRQKYDPFYNRVDSHITIIFPFESNLMLDDLSNMIKSVTDYHKPLKIELNSIGDFYPRSPVIYWEIQKNEAICELYYQLYASLDQPIPVKDYKPHVTLAREISNHRLINVKDAIASYLPSEQFEVNSIDLVTPLVNERWVTVRSFPLKK